MKVHLTSLTLPLETVSSEDIVLGPWALADLDSGLHAELIANSEIQAAWYSSLRDCSFDAIEETYVELLEQSRLQWAEFSDGREIDARVWELNVGWWLNDMLCVIFEIYYCAENLTNRLGPGLQIHAVASGIELRASSSSDFAALSSDQLWVQQIALRALRFLGVANLDQGTVISSPNHFAAVTDLQFSKRCNSQTRAIYALVDSVRVFMTACANTTGLYSSYVHRRLVRHFISAVIPRIKNVGFAIRVEMLKVKANRSSFSTPDQGIASGIGFKEFAGQAFWDLMPTKILRNLHLLVREQIPTAQKDQGPAAVFTSNAYSTDDDFKLLASLLLIRGRKLIIGQHGGNYGFGQISFTEHFESKLADKYLTWGWSTHKHQIPVGKFSEPRHRRLTNRNVERAKILLVMNSLPPRLYQRHFMPLGELENREYLVEQLKLLRDLAEKFRDLQVRQPMSNRPVWFDVELSKLMSEFPHISHAPGKVGRTIDLSSVSVELVVHTSNSTSILESAFLNQPWMAYWNDDTWRTSRDGNDEKQALLDSGVLHLSRDSIVTRILENQDNLQGWWNESGSIASRKFAKKFSKQLDLRALTSAIKGTDVIR